MTSRTSSLSILLLLTPFPRRRALPLQLPPLSVGDQMQCWPFLALDLYNWKTHNPPFSQDPQALTGLIESILLTHQPTWDGCQQLLQTLLTTEEKPRVILEARKNIPGPNGAPTQLPNEIDEAFPLNRPNWDHNIPAGREQLCLCRQVLLAGLKGAGKQPTNLVKVRSVTQGPEETPTIFLERLMEAYRMYTPFDPASPKWQGKMMMAFIRQSALDIRNKLQRLEGLQDYAFQDLMKEAEKIFNKRETPEEKEERLRKMQEEEEERIRREQEENEERLDKKRSKELSRILATVVQTRPEAGRQDRNLGDTRQPKVDQDQCTYCKEKGHWVQRLP
ncbi:uncharacterized protein LOC127227047 [Phodopus roborovskii]|uniref:uncharacterized protein LOC127227047 n=1 Tax=Phodopus roborovskii TaxID=109678 RepID=UPI0021E46798|nr:uncharacterized protein LOC127227047 [Phodopus roborovskii]